MRIFLAGAAGAIGRRLLPLLIGDGHDVTGTTRSGEKASELRSRGCEAAVVDVYDADALRDAVLRARPEIVIHQLTDLPGVLDQAQLAGAYQRNARLRIVGTGNLISAAEAAGARRFIVQSIAFAYAPGPEPHAESDPLNLADGPRLATVRAVAAMEEQALGSAMETIVLRYGLLYGPGTWSDQPNGRPALHVDAAAHAAFLAVSCAEAGVYNVADDDGAVSIAAARQKLGFDPAFRLRAV